jgi:prepilin-type processing-associated H-X9-DG protein
MGNSPHYGYACRMCRATRPTPSGGCPDYKLHTLSSMEKPAETVLMAEACPTDWEPTPGATNQSLGLSRCSKSTNISAGIGYYNAFPHNGGRNIVLCDGHAKWFMRYSDKSLLFTDETN